MEPIGTTCGCILLISLFSFVILIIVAGNMGDKKCHNKKFKYKILEVVKNGKTKYKLYRLGLYTKRPYLVDEYIDLKFAIKCMDSLKEADKETLNNKKRWLKDDDILIEKL